MCNDKSCKTCHTYIVISDVEKCSFGTFSSEEEAIQWAKHYKWPVGSWKVMNQYPTSIG